MAEHTLKTEHEDVEKRNYKRDEVIRIINSALQKTRTDKESDPVQKLLEQELQELKNIVEDSRREIGMARPGDIHGKHIPVATDELDAVINATEEASGTIMDACEAIQECLNTLDDPAARKIEEHVTKIFEACSFQDITGQRISKALKNITAIEQKISRILTVLGEPVANRHGDGRADDEEEENSLLNGPQLPDQAMSQDDIDKLLADFD